MLITTKYLSASNNLPARIMCRLEDGHSVETFTCTYHSLDSETLKAKHTEAAKTIIRHLAEDKGLTAYSNFQWVTAMHNNGVCVHIGTLGVGSTWTV